MLLWTIQVAIISLLFIFLIHNLLTFLKSTLTVPKIKDLVKTSSDKYQKIFDTLSNRPKYPNQNLSSSLSPNLSINEEKIDIYHDFNSTFTEIDKLPLYSNENPDNIINISEHTTNNTDFNIIQQPIISSSMKKQLKTFLKNQMNTDNGLDSYSDNTSNYANY